MNYDLGDLFAIHLSLKQKNEITVKQHCLLFSYGEPHVDNTQSYQVHNCQADQNAIVVSRIDNEITNLCGKTLREVMHGLFDILSKLYNYKVNML